MTVVGQWVSGAGNTGQWWGLEAVGNDREEKQTEQRKGQFWGRLWPPVARLVSGNGA